MDVIAQSIEELVGHTPLLHLARYEKKQGLSAQLLAKIEFLNPAGSIKDRAALEMILDAEEKGRLHKGSVIIEPTSGNTGIGLCAMAAVRGYQTVIVMPDSMSAERQMLMKAYGAKLVLTSGKDGMAGAIKEAERLAETIPDSMIAGQFSNPANAMAHYHTTGPEIDRATDGKVDILVCGVGTGGTITGTGRYLKEKHPDIKVVAVEPASSAVLSGEAAGKHGLQGIGAGFIPEVLDTAVYDEVVKIDEEQSYRSARLLAKTEGVLVGISSGAALAAAEQLAQRPENKGKNIVVILPDTGDRYLSTALFEE